METLTIGELAQRFGLNTSAIRYYEAKGVLPAPARVSGQRRYDTDAVRRLELLEAAKRIGFSLDEASILLQSAEQGSPAYEAVRELAADKLPEVDAVIARAQAMRELLLVATSCSCTTFDGCELFESSPEPRNPADAGAHALSPE